MDKELSWIERAWAMLRRAALEALVCRACSSYPAIYSSQRELRRLFRQPVASRSYFRKMPGDQKETHN